MSKKITYMVLLYGPTGYICGHATFRTFKSAIAYYKEENNRNPGSVQLTQILLDNGDEV